MKRREFLQGTAAAGAVLLVSDLAKGVPTMEGSPTQGSIKIPEADKITITVVTDNLYDSLRQDYKIARRPAQYRTSPLDMILHAEHGLSYHIETMVDGKAHSCLFDFGSDSRGVARNLEFLKIDLQKVEALGTSHDHFDHNNAMVEILKAKKQEFRQGIPLHVGEQFFVGTYSKTPRALEKLSVLARNEIESLGVRIVENKTPIPIIPGAYLSGRIEQITDYEKIPPNFLAKKGDEFVQETFAGEQFIVLNARGKGLAVLSSCAHRGIVNSVKTAQKITGINKVHAVIGGCHLINAKPELILRTVADIKAINPEYIVPTHCTGFEAITTFAREMPDQFILNTAGTRYTI